MRKSNRILSTELLSLFSSNWSKPKRFTSSHGKRLQNIAIICFTNTANAGKSLSINSILSPCCNFSSWFLAMSNFFGKLTIYCSIPLPSCIVATFANGKLIHVALHILIVGFFYVQGLQYLITRIHLYLSFVKSFLWRNVLEGQLAIFSADMALPVYIFFIANSLSISKSIIL